MAIGKVTGGRRSRAFVRQQKTAMQRGVRQIVVGFLEGSTYDDGTHTALVALVAEYGAGNQPETPFFRQALAEVKGDLGPIMESMLRGRSTMTIGHADAVAIAEHIEKKISASITRSGLVDTGTLRDAPDHEIE